MLKYIINQNKKIINLNQYKFSSKTLVDYDNAKSILQTLLSKQTPTQSEQLSINTEISNITQYHSKYQKSIFYNKELNYLEIRKFNRTLPIEDQKLITQNIINNTPEIESLFWKPIINREYNKCTDKNLMLVGLFSYYNESGRKINPTIGGLYPIFNNNDEYIGFFAFRESERAHGQIEMSLYLKPKIRDNAFLNILSYRAILLLLKEDGKRFRKTMATSYLFSRSSC